MEALQSTLRTELEAKGRELEDIADDVQRKEAAEKFIQGKEEELNNVNRMLGQVAEDVEYRKKQLEDYLDIRKKDLDKLKSKEPGAKRNIFLFGAGYGAVSIGCTLPLLFAMIIIPLTTGNIFHVFLSFLIYSAAMSTLMILVTYLVYWSKNNLIKKMIRSTTTIKRISGLVLILIGGYTVYKNIFSSMLWR